MVDVYQIAIRLLLAGFLSGIIGYEREIHGRAAGLRTTILVGVGSCLIMLTSMHIYDLYQGVTTVDPARIAAQVVTGIGFLGAGTILRFRASVRGLTTAAGLWAVAGIGLAVGSGFYSAALITTALIFIVLIFLSRVGRKIRKDFYKTVEIEIIGGIDRLYEIRKILTEFRAEIKDMEINAAEERGKFILSIQLRLDNDKLDGQIGESLSKIEGLTILKWI